MSLPTAGVVTALWTPTDADGRVQPAELKANVKFLRERGIHGLMVLGSTGEFLLLSQETRRQFLEMVRGEAGPLPIIANISDVRPAAVAEFGRFARELGLAAVALLPPWYYPVAQPDLVEFFVRAGEAAGLPLFLYNFPERTGNRLGLETIAAIADRVPVGGLKQSGGEFDYHGPLVALGRQKGFAVFTGGENQLAEAMALGVAGCVSGLVNALPELVLEVYNAVKAGTPEKARVARERLKDLAGRLEAVAFPLNVRAAIVARGLATGEFKTPISAATRTRHDRLVSELRALYRDWKLL